MCSCMDDVVTLQFYKSAYCCPSTSKCSTTRYFALYRDWESLDIQIHTIVLLYVITILLYLSEDADYDDDGAITSFRELREIKDCGKNWHCPWGSTIADDVAPAFKLIMEDNYLSSRSSYGDSLGQRSLWWNRRTKLDQRLCEFLR